MRQPGQTLTSSIAPALITCLRCRGFTSECAREGAARYDLLRWHRGSSSTCPAPTTPHPGQAPQPPSSDPAPVARLVVVNFGYYQIELDDALGPSSLPSSSIWCQRATPPDVPPSRRQMCHHTPGRHSPVALTMHRPCRAMPHALPSAAQVGRAVSAVEEEGGSLRAGLAASCFLHCVWETGIVGSGRLSPRW